MQTETLMDTLEALVDSNSLSRVLECLSDIAHLKADHVATNWQDDGLAKAWTKAGLACNVAYSKALTVGL